MEGRLATSVPSPPLKSEPSVVSEEGIRVMAGRSATQSDSARNPLQAQQGAGGQKGWGLWCQKR